MRRDPDKSELIGSELDEIKTESAGSSKDVIRDPELPQIDDPDPTDTVGSIPNISIRPSDVIAGVGIPQISIPAYGAS
jgi:hypothetical protein